MDSFSSVFIHNGFNVGFDITISSLLFSEDMLEMKNLVKKSTHGAVSCKEISLGKFRSRRQHPTSMTSLSFELLTYISFQTR